MFNIKPIAPVRHPAQANAVLPTAEQLDGAARVFGGEGQSNNASICADMAAKLRRFGSFVSDKQQAFAASLVERAGRLNTPAVLPAAIAAPAASQTRQNVIMVPDLFEVMQKHSQFFVGKVTISRRNQDSLCWIKHEDAEKVIGKIQEGEVTLWNRPGINRDEIVALLDELEANPLLAAKKYGKLSGRCCSCGRDLTDPESIEAGIGPVCATKFN